LGRVGAARKEVPLCPARKGETERKGGIFRLVAEEEGGLSIGWVCLLVGPSAVWKKREGKENGTGGGKKHLSRKEKGWVLNPSLEEGSLRGGGKSFRDAFCIAALKLEGVVVLVTYRGQKKSCSLSIPKNKREAAASVTRRLKALIPFLKKRRKKEDHLLEPPGKGGSQAVTTAKPRVLAIGEGRNGSLVRERSGSIILDSSFRKGEEFLTYFGKRKKETYKNGGKGGLLISRRASRRKKKAFSFTGGGQPRMFVAGEKSLG